MKTHDAARESLWITGINPVLEALRSEGLAVRELVVSRKDPRIQDILELGKLRKIPVREEARDEITQRVGHAQHQGVALRADEYVYVALDDLLGRDLREREPLVILDSVQDPQNLGALVRSACFLGARGIVVPRDRSARVTSTVIKVAAGATSFLPVVQVVNLVRALEEMQEAGLWIAGLDVEGRQTIYETDLSVPLGLVVGNEQKGIRPLVRRHCDLLVRIPALGPIQSLNAATSGAVALAEVQRQRLGRIGKKGVKGQP